MDRSVLARKQLTELKDIAASLEMRGFQRLKKAELVEAIINKSDGGGGSASRGANGDGGAAAERGNATQGDAAPARAGRPPRPERASDGDEETRVRTRTRNRDRGDSGERDGGETSNAPEQAERQQGERQQGGDNAEARGQGDGGQDRPAGERNQNKNSGGGGNQGGQGQNSGGGGNQGGGQDRGDRQGGQQRDRGDRADRGNQVGQNEDRNRRSRRERRRKGGGGGGGNQQQHQRQQRPQDDDPNAEPGEIRVGVLDILPEGYGFLRTTGYLPGDKDVYVSQSAVRRHGLRRGDVIEGPIRQQKANEKVPALHSVQKVNGIDLDENGQLPHRPDFKDMTPLFPNERLRLETPDGPISMRIVDLMAPIGKGQRGLIVSPPKAGKTTVLKELGQAIAFNSPECHLMVVLVDERPEEVTDMQRSIPGEVVASTFDRPADDHTQIAELAMERAKRLVEMGHDVVILLDSITRLARAYNLSAPASGRIMSGGVDSTALYPPKRFFGAARNIEHGGSLTIIASALIETGSKMDEVIFEEFKGTGNMELRLDRRLEQKRIFPAIDIEASGTRKEELLLDREELTIIWKLRRVLHALEGPGAIELLIDKMKQTRSNNQFLLQIQKTNLQG